jgi:class 3 adenylate cyclase
MAAGVAFCTACGTPRAETLTELPSMEDRRRVSVLFIDMIDFTPYAEHADPELVRGLQSGFYATARRVVGQFGGVVEKYIGDAVMALFGAPVATETDALRCVRAGLELQRVLAEQGLETEARVHFRAGVATGEALVDVAAAHDGGQAIVAGDVVNTASRIQSVAPPDGVLVCGRTHALTANEIRYTAQPPANLRGRSTPTEVWLALAPVPHRRAEADPDPTPLVEREHELGLLTGALNRVIRDRTPQLVTVFGQAGIGKSRLVRELHRRADAPAGARMVWRTGHCPPFGENVTYAGLADIVKAEAGIRETDPATTARDRLERAVRAVVSGPEADRLIDALGPLVGLPGAFSPGEAEEAESAWRRFLIALARRGPTVLLFEDLHWADEPMRRFIELLAATARDVPLLILGTARPELIDRDASWAGTITGSLTITLPPLRSAAMTALYGHLLGRATFSAEALRPLVEVADGNPLYAQEYVRMLVERGWVSPAQSGWSVAAGAGRAGPPMPDSVHAVIANRVDLLEPADRAVLQAAAVVGMQFWPGAVAAALGRPAGSMGSVERTLRRLEQREFVAEQPQSSMAGQTEFRFRHVLTRDVCYQRLPRTERVARHTRTADWLDALPQHRGTELAEVLAHHRWAACEIARTVGVSTQQYAPPARRALHLAARRAYALHALDAAANHLGRALGLATADDAADEPERLRLELLATEIAFYQDQAAFLAGGGGEQLRALADRLTTLARRDSDPLSGAAADPLSGTAADPLSGTAADPLSGTAADPLSGTAAAAARAWTLLCQLAWLRADRAAALALLGRAVALFEPLPDSSEKGDAYHELSRLHMLNYECEPAIAAASTAAGIAERLGLVEAKAHARITIATARYESGEPDGLAELREVTGDCRTNRLLALRRATRNLAHVVREEGDWLRSAELLNEDRALAGPGSHNVMPDYSAEAVRAYNQGDLDTFVVAAAAAQASGWEDLRGVYAYVRILRGAPAEAAADAARALADARVSGFHRRLWPALAAAALCRALLQQRAEAAGLLAELTSHWCKAAVIASGEWIGNAAFAAALTGPESAEALRRPLSELRRRTRWSEAALHTVAGAVALGRDDELDRAAREHLSAAEILAGIPAVTERMLALGLAGAALTRAGDADRAEAVQAEVRAFAARNSAPALLRISELVWVWRL